jgi:hypothetical protein
MNRPKPPPVEGRRVVIELPETPPAKGRRVPRACAASSASRTIRTVDSAARSAGPVTSTKGSGSSRDRPPSAGALSRDRGVQLALLPRFARKHVAPAASRRRSPTGRHKPPPASGRRVTTPAAAGGRRVARKSHKPPPASGRRVTTPAAAGGRRMARKSHKPPPASGRRVTTPAAAGGRRVARKSHKPPPALGRRVPRACEASSASRTIRSVDSAARSAGPVTSTKGSGRSRDRSITPLNHAAQSRPHTPVCHMTNDHWSTSSRIRSASGLPWPCPASRSTHRRIGSSAWSFAAFA